MSTFRTVFERRHTFLAVVHAESGLQVKRNVAIAMDGGADGVFLINHAIPYQMLLECYRKMVDQFPDFWIGLNCFDLGREAVKAIPQDTAGLWVDNAGFDRGVPGPEAEMFNEQRKRAGWNGIYFGGVAFKGQQPVVDVARAAQAAMPFVDVITTSGKATGAAPSVEKIRTMKKAIGEHPLAIASGINPENVATFMPYADCFLVATGISDTDTELNPARVRAFDRARS
jgi:hypothetical protein